MDRKTYSDKLKDPRWQKKRLEIFNRDEFACFWCGDKDNMLCVHHKYYISGYEPWEYEDGALITLCDACHQMETEHSPKAARRLVDAFKKAGFSAMDMQTISDAMDGFKCLHMAEVVATAYAFAFADQETQQLLLDRYFEHLASKRPQEDKE